MSIALIQSLEQPGQWLVQGLGDETRTYDSLHAALLAIHDYVEVEGFLASMFPKG